MRLGKLAAIYSIIIGIAMLGMWMMFVATDQVPELKTAFYEIGLHIIGEVITALALIIGGYALFTNKKWGLQAYMLSMGMLLYTLIVSPGYYAQRDNIVMVGMFVVFFLIAIIFVGLSFLRTREYLPQK